MKTGLGSAPLVMAVALAATGLLSSFTTSAKAAPPSPGVTCANRSAGEFPAEPGGLAGDQMSRTHRAEYGLLTRSSYPSTEWRKVPVHLTATPPPPLHRGGPRTPFSGRRHRLGSLYRQQPAMPRHGHRHHFLGDRVFQQRRRRDQRERQRDRRPLLASAEHGTFSTRPPLAAMI